MKPNILFVALMAAIMLNAATANAQTSCGRAISQLQNYAASVNQQYQYNYWQDIPNRCPAFDAWGRPYYPVVVQNCRNQLFYSLNYWYNQQCGYVNNWYAQIARTCATVNNNSRPAPNNRSRTIDQTEEIDADPIEELEEDITDSDTRTKNVTLSIPDSPSGWRPN